MKTNKKLGNDFEAEFCEILFENGFWAHNMAQNAAGQPADIVAAKNEIPYLIDCKVCSNGRFPLSRIEDNQHLSMRLWDESGNGSGWFALLIENDIYMMEYPTVIVAAAGKSVLNEDDILTHGIHLEDWIKKCK